MIVKRRVMLAQLGALLAAPRVAIGQGSKRLRHVGVMMAGAANDREGHARLEALQTELAQRGWVAGENIRFSYWWGNGGAERSIANSRELVQQNPDLIVVNGTPAVTALKQTTTTIPVVFVVVVNPVGAGLVETLARPGGNITGFSTFDPPIAGKWIETMKVAVPTLTRVGVIHDPGFKGFTGLWQALEQLAPASGLKAELLSYREATDDLDGAVGRFAARPNGGLIVFPTALNHLTRDRIRALAARHRLPAIYPFRHYAADGGLMAYGFAPVDLFRRSADYVDRILRGEQAADLPIQQPTKFELVVNLKTAKAIGLTIPPALLIRADEVIE